MKKVLYSALAAMALLGASNSWAAFDPAGSKGDAVIVGTGAVAAVAAAALVAQSNSDDGSSTSTSTSTTTSTAG
ncbi:MAG: exopolysaccharide production protein YjbE [Gibbsiella quercinecans]|uniref:Exopolysaccharide production protein YjbE n=1 Tax=Gibbsiella dentisursi TaxID=796890 RepID=A0ABP7LSS2_9GAMM|nr:hypothetical protein [Gibbsiella quercinecans]